MPISFTTIVYVALGLGGAAALSAIVPALTHRHAVANPGIVVKKEGDGLWLIYWHQPGTDAEDATLIGTVRSLDFGAYSKGGRGYSFLAEAVDGSTGSHTGLDKAANWLVHRTWRVVPGGAA